MSTKETKPNEDKQSADKQTQPIDKVAATYAATEKSLSDIETRASTARREIREQAETYARAQEERQRASAQWDYEEGQRRQAVIDKQKEEDRDRDRRHAERETAFAQREKVVMEIVAELFGVATTSIDPKQAKLALDKKIEAAEAKGKAIAEKSAASEYATKKSIDDANGAKDLALLKSDNERFKSDNAKLEAENKRLSDINTNLATRSGDLALGAFNAAGGLQKQATDSLQAAAQSGQRPVGR